MTRDDFHEDLVIETQGGPFVSLAAANAIFEEQATRFEKELAVLKQHNERLKMCLEIANKTMAAVVDVLEKK